LTQTGRLEKRTSAVQNEMSGLGQKETCWRMAGCEPKFAHLCGDRVPRPEKMNFGRNSDGLAITVALERHNGILNYGIDGRVPARTQCLFKWLCEDFCSNCLVRRRQMAVYDETGHIVDFKACFLEQSRNDVAVAECIRAKRPPFSIWHYGMSMPA
jgi:hypothetical protein